MLSWASSVSYFRVVILDEQTGSLQLAARLRRHKLHPGARVQRAAKDRFLNGADAQKNCAARKIAEAR
jgi:hypothetical protein